MLTKQLEKKLDGNYARMLQAILNKSSRQHPTRHQLYGHLPPITKTIQVRLTRHAGHCWRSRDELISNVLLWTPTYGRAKAGWPAQTYIQQLCEDMGCSSEDLPEAMNDREKWRERVRDIRASGMTWWWRWFPIQCLNLLTKMSQSSTSATTPRGLSLLEMLDCNHNYIFNVSLHFFLSIIICLHTVIWFQIFPSNTNNLYTIIPNLIHISTDCIVWLWFSSGVSWW